LILVTGATGMVGGHVLRQLTGQSAPVRALVRSEEKGDTLRGYDCELAVGSYEDAGSLDGALQGIDHVLLISPANEHMAQQEGSLVDAAVRAGSSPHIVKLAAAGVDAPGETDVNFLAQHRRVVEHLREAGLPTTVLAPNGFMQSFRRPPPDPMRARSARRPSSWRSAGTPARSPAGASRPPSSATTAAAGRTRSRPL